MTQEEVLDKVYTRVVQRLKELEDYMVPIGVSNRHVHVSEADFKVLFGEGSTLHVKSMLKQPGQFAAEEVVTIRGPKGEFSNVRVLGPFRAHSQVEISLTDSFRLGVKGCVKESGKLEDTPGLILVGPCGRVELAQGTIVALRHIHMHTSDAKRMGVKDGDLVDVQIYGPRKTRLSNVLVRVNEAYLLEMHLDTDEANAAGIRNQDIAIVQK